MIPHIETRTPKFSKWSPTWDGPFIIAQVVYGGAYKLSNLEEKELARSINRKYLKKYYPVMEDSINIQGRTECQPQAV